MDKIELDNVFVYVGMIVSHEYRVGTAAIWWIDSNSTLRTQDVKIRGYGELLPFVRNDELYALIAIIGMPSGSKVIKVHDGLECTSIIHWANLKRIDADTYIYISDHTPTRCRRIRFAGDECRIECIPDGEGFMHYDGERFWKWKWVISSGHYISSDPTYSFKKPHRFGKMEDARNGLILSIEVKEVMCMLYILCHRARDVIWTRECAVCYPMRYISAKFVSDNVVFVEINSRKGRYVFINIADNTEYELTFCG